MKQMRVTHRLSISFLLTLTWAVTVSAKDWRGLTPLISTRTDVQHVLGAPQTDRGWIIFYESEKERVSFRFSTGSCGVGSGGWKVPRDVVTSIWVTPKPFTLRFAELNLDGSKYKLVRNDHLPYIVEYVNDEEGVRYQVDTSAGGMVTLIEYYPAAKDNHLRCPPTHEALDNVLKVDEYSAIPFEREKSQLDKFAERLRRHSHNDPRFADTVVYVLAYAGRRARPAEAQERAERVTSYLIKAHRINRRRIMTVDGGHREVPSVELYLVPAGANPPLAAPTVDPREVQIIRDKGRRQRSRIKS